MFVCAAFLYCRTSVLEHFDDASVPSELDVLRVYDKVLQRQPNSKEMADAMTKLKANELTITQLQGRLMDSDEYQRIIKLQSNTLTPEIEKIIHDKQQLTFISSVYVSERTSNIPNDLLLPLRDIYIYLDYNEAAFRMVLDDPKYPDFEKKLTSEFQLTKEKTLTMFDQTFVKDDIIKASKKTGVTVQTSLNDPPIVVRAFDSTTDTIASNSVSKVAVATNPSTNTVVTAATAIQPGKEGFENYISDDLQPMGASLNDKVARTVYDKDSDSSRALFDIEQRSKDVFDIHNVAGVLNDTPDAFVYVPTIPVRYETPITHFEKKPDGNADPFTIDMFGCVKGAPI